MIYYLEGDLEEYRYISGIFQDTLYRDFGDYIKVDTDTMKFCFLFSEEVDVDSHIDLITLDELKVILRDINIDNILNNN